MRWVVTVYYSSSGGGGSTGLNQWWGGGATAGWCFFSIRFFTGGRLGEIPSIWSRTLQGSSGCVCEWRGWNYGIKHSRTFLFYLHTGVIAALLDGTCLRMLKEIIHEFNCSKVWFKSGLWILYFPHNLFGFSCSTWFLNDYVYIQLTFHADVVQGSFSLSYVSISRNQRGKKSLLRE